MYVKISELTLLQKNCFKYLNHREFYNVTVISINNQLFYDVFTLIYWGSTTSPKNKPIKIGKYWALTYQYRSNRPDFTL